MEAVKIDIYISDLLYSYDCVIVPEFGGFVANYAPAKIKEVQHQFLPPSKQISFNKNLKNNDGLLTNHISQRNKISFQEANQLIRAFVDKSLTGLKNGDKIKIDKVGELYLDPEGNIQFNEEEQNDFLLDSFGLQSFRALPIARATVEEKIQEKLSSGELFKGNKRKQGGMLWKVAAGIFFLITSGLLLNQHYEKGSFDHLEYGFFSPNVEVEATYKPSAMNDLSPKDATIPPSSSLDNEDAFFYQPADAEPTRIWVETAERETNSKVDNTKVVTSTKTNGGFHVMGGCFSQYENAQRLNAQLNKLGYSSQILGRYKNLHAVSYGSFANREDAVRMLRKVQKEHNSNAWILEQQF
jgi:hypothetical protein